MVWGFQKPTICHPRTFRTFYFLVSCFLVLGSWFSLCLLAFPLHFTFGTCCKHISRYSQLHLHRCQDAFVPCFLPTCWTLPARTCLANICHKGQRDTRRNSFQCERISAFIAVEKGTPRWEERNTRYLGAQNYATEARNSQSL